jgi:hypothetical protein
VEISESLHVWDLRSSAVALEKIFEITPDLEIKTTLLRPRVIIVQFILRPDCVIVEN